MNAREALISAVDALEKMGFVILSRSELEAKGREIAKLREALREAAVALDQACEDVACWGSYAGEYFQDKHDLEGDLDRLAKQASAARRALEGGQEE